MKKILLILSCLFIANCFATSLDDPGPSNEWSSHNNSYRSNGNSHSSYSGLSNSSTHYVNGHTRSNGAYVSGHYAGNPGSGVHCKNNYCQ